MIGFAVGQSEGCADEWELCSNLRMDDGDVDETQAFLVVSMNTRSVAANGMWLWVISDDAVLFLANIDYNTTCYCVRQKPSTASLWVPSMVVLVILYLKSHLASSRCLLFLVRSCCGQDSLVKHLCPKHPSAACCHRRQAFLQCLLHHWFHEQPKH